MSLASTFTVRLPALHPAQQQIVSESARFNVVSCGRRFGKSTLGLDLLIDRALDGVPVAWFSPSYKMLADAWRECYRAVAEIARPNVQERRLDLIGGGSIDMWSLDQPHGGRGRKYARIAIDEAALVPDLAEAWQASIRPTLTDLAGDAWFFSTPRGHDFFWQLHRRGAEGDPEWRAWRMESARNPHIPPEEIEAARRELPERIFAQEYLAEFLSDGGGVFRNVAQASTAQPQTERVKIITPTFDTGDQISHHEYVMGVDWGKLNDFTVLSVLDVTTGEQVAFDRFNRIDYAVQRQRLATLAGRFQPSIILAESNAMGEPILEQIARDGLPVQPFTTTNASKAKIIDGLALALERSRLRILPDPTQTSELLAYEAQRLPGGMLRYSAPSGVHDDCVMALALSWAAADLGGVVYAPSPYG